MRIVRGISTAAAVLVSIAAAIIANHASAFAQSAPSVQGSAVQLAAGDAAFENPDSVPGKTVLTDQDNAFLDDMEQRGIQFFVDEADPVTGLMPDRSRAVGGRANGIASIASVGFGLTALCIGDDRGWVGHQEAYDRSMRVLTFLRDRAPQEHGHFYHFLDMHTGKRVWNCEVSNIDTALLMAGVLTVRQHFPDTELAAIADGLYESVEWPWLLTNQHPGKAGTTSNILCMGWKPETGFVAARWSRFSEGPMIYLLALGSKKHPLSAESWQTWKRQPITNYAGLTFLQCPPLFTHQYPQCWFDLRGLRDDYADYFRDSQLATLAQRQWCMGELSKRFPTYGPNMWGLTASDRAGGYTAWGGPPKQGDIDGTVVPTAAGGSLAFEPRLCLDALESMKQHYGDKNYLKYGFVDAFNPSGWYDKDNLGIDIGPMVLMAENCRSGSVWKTFMSCPEARAALRIAGFRPVDQLDENPTSSLFKSAAEKTADGDD